MGHHSTHRAFGSMLNVHSQPNWTWQCLLPESAYRGEPWESKKRGITPPLIHGISKITLKVVIFHFWPFTSHISYTSQVISQSRTKVKLNRVFFPDAFTKQGACLYSMTLKSWIVTHRQSNTHNDTKSLEYCTCLAFIWYFKHFLYFINSFA